MSTKSSTQHSVSIIIATYNSAKTLQACLDSIYTQTYPHLQIIVIDGNSTDGTPDILKANSSKLHYWISEPDNGIYYALNKGIAQATGNYIYFLGSDDELTAEFSKMAAELNQPNFIYYGSVAVNDEKPLGKVSNYYLAKQGIIQQAIIYPKAVFKKYSYNLKYKISADSVLNMTSFTDKAFKVIYLNYVIAKYSTNGISGTSRDLEYEKDKPSLILKHYGLVFLLRFMFKQFKKKLFKRK